jgi:peptide chain release factor subunit 1
MPLSPSATALGQLDVSDLIESPREDVLSVSLDIDPTKPEYQHDPPAYLIWLRETLKETTEGLPKVARREAEAEAQRILDTLTHDRPAGRGVAFYAARDLWRIYVLPVPLPSRVRYGRPDLMPVLWAVDEYEPYAILVVDHRHARIVLAYLGRAAVVDKESMWLNVRDWRFGAGRPPTSTREEGIGVGRGSAPEEFQARVEAHEHRFWAHAAEATDRFLGEARIDRLIIGGSDEAVSVVRNALPKSSRDKVIALLHVPAQAGVAEIRDRTLPVALAEEHRRQAAMIATVLERAGARGGAVIGLAPTLEALIEREVHVAVVDRNLETNVWQCKRCGYVSADPVNICPICGGVVERMTLPEVLPVLVHRNRARLEVVSHDAATGLAEGVGALLRYVPGEEPPAVRERT